MQALSSSCEINYISNIEDRITFKTKTGYYPEFLMPEAIKLFGSTEKKCTSLEITEVILAHCNNVSSHYQPEDFSMRLFQIKHLVNYYRFHQLILYFHRHLIQSFQY